MLIKKIILTTLFLLVLSFPKLIFAQEIPSIIRDERAEAVVESILNEKQAEVFGKKQTIQELDIKFTSGTLNKQNITIKNGELPAVQQTLYKPGDKIVISISKNLEGQNIYLISDFVRRDVLIWLVGIFVTITLLIGGRKGLFSLLGLVFSFFIIFAFILPKILNGSSPTMIAIIGSALILPLNFYLSHGVNKKTTVAIISTFLSLAFTGFLANVFISSAHLTGYASDEATFLQVAKQGSLNMQGLLLAGIIIGLLGILDDVTVAQAAIVFELKQASEKLTLLNLYKKAMNVGKDHIASVVNTLVLVYAGASLPLLLLFINNPLPIPQVVNFEMIAEQIVQTLVASIGLILSIPLTTLLAAWIATKNSRIIVPIILLFLLLFPVTNLFPVYATTDPASVPNNRFGIHIISPTFQEVMDASELVNSQGGDWGYVTVVIEDHDLDQNKWQNFFNLLRQKHLIPLLRLATHPVGDNWARPDIDLAKKYADFLDSLNWPVKNRYVIVYNEPNQAHEWGGSVDPEGYAKVLDQTIDALKQKNPDFFVMNAGFDASAPQELPNYEEEQKFLLKMQDSVPGIFAKLDGWVSHSYPNPGFIGKPDDVGKGTVRTFEWELSKLAQIGLTKKLPVFITETGWKHAEGISFSRYYPGSNQVAEYYKQAFQEAWSSSQVVAVTPFILNYQQPPFDHFSFKKITGEKQEARVLGAKYPDDSLNNYHEQYSTIKDLPKSAGKPIQSYQAKLIKGEVYTSVVAGESYKIQLTFKNIGQSIWNDNNSVVFKALQGQKELGMIITNPDEGKKIEPGGENTFNIEFKAPQAGKFKISLNLFVGDNQFTNSPVEFETEVKSPVILQVQSSLKWKNNFTGQYLLSVVGPISESLNFALTKEGISQEVEARELLPDYTYDFTLTKPFYKPKTISQNLTSGLNVLDFGVFEPDFISVIFNPQELWQLLPWSN